MGETQPLWNRKSKERWYRTHDRYGRPIQYELEKVEWSRTHDRSGHSLFENPADLEEVIQEEIPLETIGEETPLIPESVGSAAAGAAGGAASGVSSLGAWIGGLLAAGGIGALYAAIHKAIKGEGGDDRKGGLNVPGHKYIGPFNRLNRGDPVDLDDLIAYNHDVAYDTAKTVDDVQKADAQAIAEFLQDYHATGNYHSLLGVIGLKGKVFVEKLTGHLYPSLPGKEK
uniref:VP n=1 Tax=Emberiza tristrami ambidensovirus TaxID=2794447 RepID=A0A8A4XE67_9VIRU|nr:MAG: VP [Emberiza tristrami ambidensovirus]